MQTIELYPDQQNLMKGLGGAAVLAFIGMQFHGVAEIFAYLIWLVAAALAVQSGSALIWPKPSFAADADGFSVMGKPKRPWSEFQGVRIESVRIYLIPVARWITVRAGARSLFAKKLQIKATHLSGSPKEMAETILQAASLARMGALTPAPAPVSESVKAPIMQAPVKQAPVTRAKPAAPRPDAGPIQTSRGLFDRGRKVI